MLGQHLPWLLHTHCANQQDLRHPVIVLEKTSMPTLLYLYLFVLFQGICSFEKQWQHTEHLTMIADHPPRTIHLAGSFPAMAEEKIRF